MDFLWSLYEGKDWKIEPSLERIERACAYTGNPQRSFPALLVGGTNGKGSTCAFTERLLREHGLKTGWFVSPHLVSERERWRVNGEPVSPEKVKFWVEELKEVFGRFGLTYFEAATLLALHLFKEEGVDLAVMEVGMGGRWDATKVAQAEAVAITNAERDHTKWLGETVEEIAREKLALYREGKPLFLGSARYPLYPLAVERGVEELMVAGLDFTYRGETRGAKTYLLSYELEGFSLEEAELSLWGKWQADNSALALALASRFVKLKEEAVKKALSSTKWEGRMEVLREKPLLMIDASHNPYAVAKVAREVKKHFPRLKLAFSSLKGKDWELSLKLLRRHFKELIVIPIKHHRAEEPERLIETAKGLGFEVKLMEAEEVPEVKEDLLVLGSVYLIGEVKRRFSCPSSPPRR